MFNDVVNRAIVYIKEGKAGTAESAEKQDLLPVGRALQDP